MGSVQVLATWPYWDGSLNDYVFEFIPSTIGIYSGVRWLGNGDYFDLSRYFDDELIMG